MKFSIVMASYNQTEFVEEAINSVLAQTYDNFELIIIDGGSSDGTGKILEKYMQRPKVKVVIEKDKGMYHARNKGILMATGDILGFLNTDDYYEPIALETISGAFHSDPASDVIYGLMHAVDKNGVFIKERGSENIKLKERIRKYDPLPDQSTFFRKRCIPHLGLYNTTYKIISDWDYWQRAIMLGLRFKRVNRHISNFRRYEECLTFNPKYEKLRFKEINRLYRNYNTAVISHFLLQLHFRYYFIMPLKRIRLFAKIYTLLKREYSITGWS